MLKQRLLTAVILLPLLLAALFYLDSRWIGVLFGVVVIAGAWEWSALAGLRSRTTRAGYVSAMLVIGTALIYLIAEKSGNAVSVATVSALFWLLALMELIRSDAASFGILGTQAGKLLSGGFVLLPMWASVFFLHAIDPHAPMLLLWMLVIVWIADSVAYLVGTTMGRHKLAPTVSPGKTIEGAVGALVAVALVTAVGGSIVPGYSGSGLVRWTIVGVIVAMISIVGDLVESKFKRLAGVKDSGRLLPGHGGVLDRMDAVTSAAPVFVVSWFLLLAGSG